MIIFYRKSTGEVFGTVDGRIHPEDVRNGISIKPDDVPEDDIGKYEVAYEPVFEEVEDDKGKMVRRVKELQPAELKDEMLAVEKGEERILGKRLEFDGRGKLKAIAKPDTDVLQQ